MSQFDEPSYEQERRQGDGMQTRPVQGTMPGKCPACGRAGLAVPSRTDVFGVPVAWECKCGAVM